MMTLTGSRPASDVLMAEHRGIEAVLTVLEQACDALAAGRPVPPDLIPKCVDFFRNFADRCHHFKEEEHYFPRLAQRGIAVAGGPVGVMLEEHAVGRQHLASLEDAHARGDWRAVVAEGRAYAHLLRQHIRKEDECLFPMGNRVLTPADQESLANAFDDVERLEMGEGVHEQYHHLIHELVEAGNRLVER
jgi:hemerythrin-like domain-containing protein